MKLLTYEILYFDVRIVKIFELVINNFENDLKLTKLDERINNLFEKRYFDILISYDTLTNIIDYLKSVKSFESRFGTLYNEIMFKL